MLIDPRRYDEIERNNLFRGFRRVIFYEGRRERKRKDKSLVESFNQKKKKRRGDVKGDLRYLLREEDKVLERCHRSFSSSRGAVSVSVKMCTRYSRREKGRGRGLITRWFARWTAEAFEI